MSGISKTYICSICGKKETIDHINPIVEPYLCWECWKIKHNVITEGENNEKTQNNSN